MTLPQQLMFAGWTPGRSDRIGVIPLTRGKITIVDQADFEWLNAFSWHALFNPDLIGGFYAARSQGGRSNKTYFYMHRVIMGAQLGQCVDHIDRNPLNNCRANLRIVPHRVNSLNAPLLQVNNRSGFRGVSWSPERGKWAARIKVNYRTFSLGRFVSAEEAAHAYDSASRKYFGEVAPRNFPSSFDVPDRSTTKFDTDSAVLLRECSQEPKSNTVPAHR